MPAPAGAFDRLVAVPFRQVAERGFEAHDDGTPLVVVDIESELEVLGRRGGRRDRRHRSSSPTAAASRPTTGRTPRSSSAIIRDEIGQGEGANLVVGRHYRAAVADWGADKALTVFRRLLERERGAYWTYSSSPATATSSAPAPSGTSRVHGGDVRMNPISGTFRIPRRRPTGRASRRALLDFLADEKEIYELFMVVDEELKMMCDICHEGGQVLGPFLKPMTHLVHTEYLLAGRTLPRRPRGAARHDVRRHGHRRPGGERLPADQAVRVRGPRLLRRRARPARPRRATGGPVVDSPIVIRTADVGLDGGSRSRPGPPWCATRTRRTRWPRPTPRPAASSARSAWCRRRRAGRRDRRAGPRRGRAARAQLRATGGSAGSGSPTRSGAAPDEPAGRSVVILDGEDDFVNMLRHVLGVLGMTATVVRHEDYRPGVLDGHDLVIVGPGPGDPRDGDHPKIAAFRAAVDELLATGSRSSRSASATRRCASGSASRSRSRTSSSRAPSRRSASTAGPSGSVSTTRSSARAATATAARRRHGSRPTRRPATSTCSPGRTTAASSSTPSRSSPRTAST